MCKGGANVAIGEGQKRELCCDGFKGDEEITINPQNYDQMQKIKYTKNGEIYTGDSVLDDDINNKLRLNGVFYKDGRFKCDTSTELIKGRRDAYTEYESIIHVLNKRGKLTSTAVLREIQRIESKEKMPEFAGVILYFLQKKYKSLLSQNK